MNVKGNHQLAEVLSRKLFGIGNVPKDEQERMINRAIKAAIEWHTVETVNLINSNATLTPIYEAKNEEKATMPILSLRV